MKVTVKTIKGEKKDIELIPEEKIASVQLKVQEAHGVPAES